MRGTPRATLHPGLIPSVKPTPPLEEKTMGEERRTRPGFLLTMIVCFVIAAVAFSGVILRDDVVGRVIFGVVWTALGLVWLGSYFGAFFGRTAG